MPTKPVEPPTETFHIMGTYKWGAGGSGLRQGFKCTCGWYISENDPRIAQQHLEMEAAVVNMNNAYQKALFPRIEVTL